MFLKPGIWGPTQGLVAYYSMDRAYLDGSTVTDVTTNNNNGTLRGAAYLIGDGISGEPARFDGTQGTEITLPSLGFSGNVPITISAWILVPTSSNNMNNIFGFGQNPGPGNSCSIRTRNDHEFLFYFWSNDLVATAPSNYYGSWHHVVARYDSFAQIQSVFLDGDKIGSRVADTPDFKDQNYSIGGYNGDSGEWFNGQIDEVRIYDKILSNGEIQTLAGQ